MIAIGMAGCSNQQDRRPVADGEGAAEASDNGPKPVVVVDQTDAYLGLVDPAKPAEKAFAIRNAGAGPLVLERGGTSCKCTMSALPEKPIMPGEAAVVRVSTKSEEREGCFDHTATVLTNDPSTPRIEFRVRGTFQTVLAFDPPNISATLKEGERAELKAAIYSQVFRDFEVESFTSPLKGVSWEVKRADDYTLKRLEARCAYWLELKVSPDQDTGNGTEPVEIRVRSDDEPPRHHEAICRVGVHTTPRTTFGGKSYYAPTHTLAMGSLRRWCGAEERITLTVSDEHRKLAIQAIEKTPEFLEVKVVPMVPDRPDSGLYWISVAIPKDAPPSNYAGNRKGEVRIFTDHPERPVLKFWVQFAISNS